MTLVTNKDAANTLFNVATILEMTEDNPYRIRAYRRAARTLLARPAANRVQLVAGKSGKELDMPGLGPRLRQKLGELLSTGRLRFYVELSTDLPTGVQNLLQIPGVGPKSALRLHEELGVSSPADVAAAAKSGRIRTLFGFGAVRERSLGEAAAALVPENVRQFPAVQSGADLDEIDRPEAA